jgi:hypothetical protein
MTSYNNLDTPFMLDNSSEKKISNFDNREIEGAEKIRRIRDQTTDAYCEVFLNSESIYLKMIIYIFYSYVNFFVERIIRQGKLINNERVIFYFKGGNVMHFWRKRILQQIFAGEPPEFEELNRNTKVSDNDFSIYILTDSNMRYNYIYNIVKKNLSEALLNLGNLFDNLYENRPYNGIINQEQAQEHLNNYRETLNNDDLGELEKIESMHEHISILFEHFYTESKINEFKTRVAQKNIELRNNLNEEGIILKEKSSKSLIKYRYMGNEINNNTIEINKRINTSLLVVNDLVNIAPIKLYGVDNTVNPKTLYNIDLNNLGPIPDPNGNQENKNYHYMTTNNTVFNNLIGNNVIINFDLIRLKFSTNLINTIENSLEREIQINDNGFGNMITIEHEDNYEPMDYFKIPSEFIDVSIPRYNDTLLEKSTKHHMEDEDIMDLKLPFINLVHEGLEIGEVRHLSIDYIIIDLEDTLFSHNGNIIPFMDVKYPNRIFRLIFFFFYKIWNTYQAHLGGIDLINRLEEIFPANLFNIEGEWGDNFLTENNLPRGENWNYLIHTETTQIFNIIEDFSIIKRLINFLIIVQYLQNYSPIVYEQFLNIQLNNNNIQNGSWSVNSYSVAFDRFKLDINNIYTQIRNYFFEIPAIHHGGLRKANTYVNKRINSKVTTLTRLNETYKNRNSIYTEGRQMDDNQVILNRFKNVFDKIEKPIVKMYNYKKNNIQQNIKPIMTNIESLENLL